MNPIGSASERHDRALALFSSGDYRGAAHLLDELLAEKETSGLWNDWAAAKLMCSEIPASERGLRRALELDAQNAHAAGNLAALLARDGRISEAIPLFESAARYGSGQEREQILRLLQNYRLQLQGGADAPIKVIETMAQAIHQQSIAISALAGRIGALENSRGTPAKTAAPLLNVAPKADAGTIAPPNGKITRPKPGVLLRGPIYGASGYAEECWTAALALEESGIPLRVEPFGDQEDRSGLIPRQSAQRLRDLHKASVDIPSSIVVQAAPALYWDKSLFGKVSIGRTMFETDSIPAAYRGPCNAMDEVWVPGPFNLRTFAAGGVEPDKLRIVPGGIDASVFHPGAEPVSIPAARDFNFLSVFDWQDRKNYRALLSAYLREFTADDDVALILKVYRQTRPSADIPAEIGWMVERELKLSMSKAPGVILIDGLMTSEDVTRLYSTANCFVLPTRGEGYGRPFLEAMACGLPVIATNWGGQADFLNESNSYLIESKLVNVPPNADIALSAGQRWADPDADHLRALMRHVYSSRDEAGLKAQQGRKDVLAKYDWKVVMPLWVSEFRRLLA